MECRDRLDLQLELLQLLLGFLHLIIQQQQESTLISPTTRHLIHFGTETTIGSPSTQDDMFIRFSVDENINEFAIQQTNTAGSQRLQDGTKIMGALVAKEKYSSMD